MAFAIFGNDGNDLISRLEKIPSLTQNSETFCCHPSPALPMTEIQQVNPESNTGAVQEMGMDLEWEGKSGNGGVSPTQNYLRLRDFQPQVSHKELSSLAGMNYILV